LLLHLLDFFSFRKVNFLLYGFKSGFFTNQKMSSSKTLQLAVIHAWLAGPGELPAIAAALMRSGSYEVSVFKRTLEEHACPSLDELIAPFSSTKKKTKKNATSEVLEKSTSSSAAPTSKKSISSSAQESVAPVAAAGVGSSKRPRPVTNAKDDSDDSEIGDDADNDDGDDEHGDDGKDDGGDEESRWAKDACKRENASFKCRRCALA
jgi:hypothetical protein